VKSEDLKWDIPLERRITIIRGDSGNGKTTLANLMKGSPNNGVEVDLPMKFKVADSGSWEDYIKYEKDTLIIFDELVEVGKNEFALLLNEYADSGNYFLIFSRIRLGVNKLAQLNIAASSILRFVTSKDGLEHYTEPYVLNK
jgi:hypothetical protein